MATRTFVALLAVLLICLPGSAARAQPQVIAVDGCAKLARIVYDEVSSSALYGPGKSGPWLIDIGQGDLSICTHASRTVSRAFTSAMKTAGVEVYWGHEVHSGHCRSTYLSQCYPHRFSPGGPETDADYSLVQESWAVVLQAVMREMYNPFSSDEVRFRDHDLKLRMGLSLRSVGPVNVVRLPSRQ